jgi:hypothetical protein
MIIFTWNVQLRFTGINVINEFDKEEIKKKSLGC